MTDLIEQHGGYRKLKSFQVSQLIYDITVRFVDKYISRFSRTTDQMVQAARSGVQNIAEGSQASATSRETEIKLTQVARASLEELKLDYEDFLRQNGLEALDYNHPALVPLKTVKPQTVEKFANWVATEHQKSVDLHRQARNDNRHQNLPVGASPYQSLSSACLAANGALTLLNLACYLLDQQVKKLAEEFKEECGFKERMYKVRSEVRDQHSSEPNAPNCPRCEKVMRKRFPANHSENCSPFWGCSDFPNCKGTKSITANQ